jgi:hypothetical protein
VSFSAWGLKWLAQYSAKQWSVLMAWTQYTTIQLAVAHAYRMI